MRPLLLSAAVVASLLLGALETANAAPRNDQYGYDAAGRLISARLGDLQITYQYDAAGNLVARTVPEPSAGAILVACAALLGLSRRSRRRAGRAACPRGNARGAVGASLLALALGLLLPPVRAWAVTCTVRPSDLGNNVALRPAETLDITITCDTNCTYDAFPPDPAVATISEAPIGTVLADQPVIFTLTAAANGQDDTSSLLSISFTCGMQGGSLEKNILINDPRTETTEDHATGTDGDPVSTRNGELFQSFPPDLDLGGPLPVRFSRYYASRLLTDGRSASALGDNWLHNFAWKLQSSSIRVNVTAPNGRLLRFLSRDFAGTDFVLITRGDIPFQLTRDGATRTFTLTDPRHRRMYRFNNRNLLHQILDGRGNVLTLSYNLRPGLTQLSGVTDGLGRTLTFGYDASGRLMASVSDGTRTVQFGHTGSDLTSVTDAQGRTTTVTYDPGGLMTATMRPAGNTPFRQTFSAAGEVLTQTNATGDTTAFAYSPPVTTITDPLGAVRTHTHADSGELLESRDRAGQSVLIGSDVAGRRTAITDRLGDVTRFSYHAPSGKIASLTEADGTTTSLSYTARPLSDGTLYDLTGISQPDGTTESFAYDAAGNPISHTDRAGAMASATYDAHGQVLTATNRLGGVTTNTYNADGTRATTTDPAGNTSDFAYDALKRLTQITHPDGSTTLFGYDERDRVTSLTDENGRVTTFVYDANGRLERAFDGAGDLFTLSYDANDRLVEMTGPFGPTAQSYDPLGRIDTRTDGNGNVTRLGYDLLGRLTAITDPLGNVRARAYDAERVITSRTDPLGNTTQLVSDRLGRITQITSPLAHVSGIDYDALGRVVALTNPLGETTTLSRDARGLLSEIVLAEPTVRASYARNARGQITTLTDPNGNDWLRSVDPSGRTVSRTDPLGHVRSIAYDSRNRPSTITFPGGLGTQTLTFDPAGNLTELNHSDGTLFQYTYDVRDRLLSANEGPGSADTLTRTYEPATGQILETNGIAITRDAGKRLSSMDFSPPTGKAVSYAYDAASRVTQVTDWLGASTTLSYDAAGHLTGIARPNGVSTHFVYGSDGRLIEIREERLGGITTRIALTRDAVGQITAATRDVPQAASLAGLADLTHSYDAASQVAGHSYDALGRLTASSSGTFSWNLASQLISYSVGGSTVENRYDGLGRRIARTAGGTTRTFVWNDALALPSISIERDDRGDLRYYVHLPDGRLLYSIEAASGDRRFYHYDEMGNTIFVTDDAGALLASYAHTPYGELLASTGTLDNPFTWQGQNGIMDEGNGLYTVRARYYDSATARFLSRDPVRSIHPKGVNPYAYALANPKRFVDVTGTEPSRPCELDQALGPFHDVFGGLFDLKRASSPPASPTAASEAPAFSAPIDAALIDDPMDTRSGHEAAKDPSIPANAENTAITPMELLRAGVSIETRAFLLGKEEIAGREDFSRLIEGLNALMPVRLFGSAPSRPSPVVPPSGSDPGEVFEALLEVGEDTMEFSDFAEDGALLFR